MPLLRKTGYELAREASLVLSTRIERPGAEERYEAMSSGERAPDLESDCVSVAVFQSVGMLGE